LRWRRTSTKVHCGGYVPPVVPACLWTGCGRKKDWDRGPLLGNPHFIFVSVRAARLSRPDGGSPLQEVAA
jgi:hypothetical protein